jgi:hypothetical protein
VFVLVGDFGFQRQQAIIIVGHECRIAQAAQAG